MLELAEESEGVRICVFVFALLGFLVQGLVVWGWFGSSLRKSRIMFHRFVTDLLPGLYGGSDFLLWLAGIKGSGSCPPLASTSRVAKPSTLFSHRVGLHPYLCRLDNWLPKEHVHSQA